MFGFAKKIGMTRLFLNGRSVPVTAFEFEESFVLQQKTLDKDGYQAVQIGGVKKTKDTKAAQGHIKKYSGLDNNLKFIVEYKNVEILEGKKSFTIEDFQENDLIDILGTTIGRGFAGPIKKFNFAGQPASHGHDHERAVGSIGTRWPQRTLPGKRMAGRFGGASVRLKAVKIIAIDKENSLIFVHGSTPGSNSSYSQINKVSK